MRLHSAVDGMAAQHGPGLAVQHTTSSLDGETARSGPFVTVFHAQLNLAIAELRSVDAGHGQAFLRRGDGRIESLLPWGLPLGVSSRESYREGSITLGAGDLLVIYSDGLTEARPDLFRAQATLASQIPADEPASATAQRLVELATAAGPPPDDLTVVAVRRPAPRDVCRL